MTENEYISREPMLEMFIFETVQLIEQLEEILMKVEKENTLEPASINEIFRIMHTIKGSSAMMMFDGISTLAHSLEDLFSCIRAKKDLKLDCSGLTDIVLQVVDFIKGEIYKIEMGKACDGNSESLVSRIKEYMRANAAENGCNDTAKKEESEEKQEPDRFYISAYQARDEKTEIRSYSARVFFQDGCQMENIRAYTIVHNLKDIAANISYEPGDIIENERSAEPIKENGFAINFNTDKTEEEINRFFAQTLYLDRFELCETEYVPEDDNKKQIDIITKNNSGEDAPTDQASMADTENAMKTPKAKHQNFISVNLNKLDKLMDLVGEIVISEAMVTKNPEIAGLSLDSFNKAARQLRKLTNELQDIVMSIRMIPVEATFRKMQRVVRDMNRKLGKDVELQLLGEDTEVDKNVIDHLSDPLMHLIRNALDHGIESREERIKSGKPEKGRIMLEAKNAGGDVLIIVKDDGKGLDKSRILEKAKQHGLLSKPENEYSEREIYSFIMLPGFSTKESVSEFSGRGVGMDVVRENIEKIGGSILIDSTVGAGTSITIKIPLTLAIIDGMLISTGKSRYIIPTMVIRESFRAEARQIITDTEGNELIMIRGECYPIIRVHKRFGTSTKVTKLDEGIIVVVETDSNKVCLFADELIGEQQVVVKPIPAFIKRSEGLAGCTIQGDGSISLIIDVNGMFNGSSKYTKDAACLM